jgi:S1-C subfamily serine protease
VVGINTAGIRGAQNTNFAVAMKYACRVLELLQQGTDPSPPDLKLVYFRDVDDRRELKVARSYAGEGMLQLMPGDVIRRVVGADGRIENETQLLDALRGRLEGARIVVTRAGQELVLEGARPPMERVLETRGVYASGVLFGLVTVRDAPEIGARGLMVHFVESGSVGESREIEKADLLEAVDGTPAPDLETLRAMLHDAAQSGRRVTLTLKRFAGGDSLFSYTQRTLPVSEPQMIGPQPATRSAEAPLH